MTLFRIYCGLAVGSDRTVATYARSAKLVHELASEWLESYTIIESNGCWKGQQERTLIVEYMTDRAVDITKVRSFAHAYKWGNNQESVAIIETDSKVDLY